MLSHQCDNRTEDEQVPYNAAEREPEVRGRAFRHALKPPRTKARPETDQSAQDETGKHSVSKNEPDDLQRLV